MKFTPMRSLNLRMAFWIMLTAMLSACGGGSSDSPPATSITTNPKSISFTMMAGASVMAHDVTATFKGSGVVVGYPPGEAIPYWLTITETGSTTGTQASFLLTATAAGLQPGTYQTSVRFVTGVVPAGGSVENATQIVSVDVPVKLTIVALGVSTPSISMDVINGSSPSSGSFSINSSTIWAVTSNQSWLKLDKSSGSGDATIGYSIDTNGLSSGTHIAAIAVTDPATGLATFISVWLNIKDPLLTANPSGLALAVDASTTLEQLAVPLTISDQLGGSNAEYAASWSLDAIDVPWLSMATTSGSTSPTKDVMVSVEADKLAALKNGTHVGHITLNYTTKNGGSHTITIPFTLQLTLPRVAQAAPYIVSAQQQYQVTIRGTGFNGLGSASLKFGTQTISSPTIVSDTEIRVNYPQLDAGIVNVYIPNNLGISSNARLIVKDDAALPGGTFSGGAQMQRIFLDSERNVLYGVDGHNSKLYRFSLQGNAWVLQTPIPVPGTLVDAALSTDGKAVVMITENLKVYELDLSAGSSTPQQTASLNADSYMASYYYFKSIAFTNDNIAIITSGFKGSGSTPAYAYNRSSKTLSGISGLNSLYNGTVWASGDGGTILLPQNGLSPDPELAAYNTSTGIGYLTPVRINMSTISMSRDGSVVMFDSGNVYDRYFGLLGNIGWSLRFLVSPDGTRAYAYIMNSYTGDPEGVDVYDLTTPVGSGFKKLTRLPLSPTILAPGAYGVALGISPDGKTLFVWATAKMVAIPL